MIIKFKISRIVNVSKYVALWNTWDHEHLPYVHNQFGKSTIIHEDSNSVFIKTKMKIPFLPFFINSLHTLTNLDNNDVLVIDTLPLGIIVKLKMQYIALKPKKTKLINYYEMDLPFIFYPFKNFIIKMITKWNRVNWMEDLPLKMRRQLALDYGFKDFFGNDHKQKNNLRKLTLPLPRLKDSILNNEN